VDRSRIVTGSHGLAKRERAKQLRQTMTAAEIRLWQHLRAGRLGGFHFRRQQIIDGFIADFYCHAAGLIIEVDGDVHETQPEYDAERDRVLAARSLRILRLTNEQVFRDLPACLVTIREAASMPRDDHNRRCRVPPSL
jgi:very-short-patch-repair endonuclease